MTTANTKTGAVPKTAQPSPRYRLPDPPEPHPDDMTSAKHLALTGNAHHLIHHFGNPDTTLVAAERYIVLAPHPGRDAIRRSPDLLIAFNVDPQAYEESNGYIISEQSKPPDFVLEVASPRTGHIDVGEKRDDYAALGIPEYWRFDETETGRYHGARLAGERLENGQYAPIPIDELDVDVLQGYSPILNLAPALGTRTVGLARPGHRPPHPHLRRPAGPRRPRRRPRSRPGDRTEPVAKLLASGTASPISSTVIAIIPLPQRPIPPRLPTRRCGGALLRASPQYPAVLRPVRVS